MKKNKIRLTLNRETLRSLEQEELRATPGGAVILTYTCFNCVTQSCPTKCGQTYCYYV
jgi:hypothetical protein